MSVYRKMSKHIKIKVKVLDDLNSRVLKVQQDLNQLRLDSFTKQTQHDDIIRHIKKPKLIKSLLILKLGIAIGYLLGLII